MRAFPIRSLSLLVASGSVVLASGLAGCSAASDVAHEPETNVDTDSASIIGGFDAKSAKLNAIGALVRVYEPYPSYPGTTVGATSGSTSGSTAGSTTAGDLSARPLAAFEAGVPDADPPPPSPPYPPQPSVSPFCSGALIGPRTVLTAKHCVEYLAPNTSFAIGWNAESPERLVRIVDVEVASLNQGGWVERGSDVAVVHLAEAVTDIEPLAVGTLSEADLDTKLVGIGYGVRDVSSNFGTRRMGTMTLRALEGRIYELMFGSYEKYLEAFGVAPTPPSDAGGCIDGGDLGDAGPGSSSCGTTGSSDDYYRYLWESKRLLSGYEAFVGGKRGDAQACFGDSGGPLLARRNGKLVIVGVTSGGRGSQRMPCDYGAVYSIFGPTTKPFVDASISWTDPCEGVPAQGTCDGAIARRCTEPSEGPRRVQELDCEMLGLACGLDHDGRTGCLDGTSGDAGAP